MLIALLALVGVGALYLFVKQLDATQMRMARDRATATALLQAKEALIGYAISYGDSHPESLPDKVHGFLPCPDIDGSLGINPEGSSEPTCGSKNYNSIGRLPWRTLGLSMPRDGDAECLWYAVAGTYKNNPKTDEQMNWDNNGQLQVLAADGAPITASDNQAVAVVFAAGTAQPGQDRSAANTPVCGGNLTATNYLDNDTIHAINNADIAAGKFILPHDHRDANGNIVLTINDNFTFITKDEIFRKVMRRSDFASDISNLLDQLTPLATAMPSAKIMGTKGTDRLDCDDLAEPTKNFCKNWKEMLFLVQLSSPSQIKIDGVFTTTPCDRVLIFAGQKTAGQVRLKPNQSDPANYLEEPNLTAFNTHTSNFIGTSTFNRDNPSADILRCLP